MACYCGSLNIEKRTNISPHAFRCWECDRIWGEADKEFLIETRKQRFIKKEVELTERVAV